MFDLFFLESKTRLHDRCRASLRRLAEPDGAGEDVMMYFSFIIFVSFIDEMTGQHDFAMWILCMAIFTELSIMRGKK